MNHSKLTDKERDLKILQDYAKTIKQPDTIKQIKKTKRGKK